MPDIFLYQGEANPFDVRLADPTVLMGGLGAIISADANAIGWAVGSAAARLYGATTWRSIGWLKHPKSALPIDGELR